MSTFVSIITVVYNCEETIGRTIESVLAQTYTDLEYLIIDGASGDASVAIAERYRPRFEERGISYRIVSEPDRGMYDALNKGTRLAKGTLIGQINADDWYEPDAVETMVRLYEQEHYEIAWGSVLVHRTGGATVKHARLGSFWLTSGFCHPAMFSERDVLLKYPYACIAMDDDFDMVTRAHLGGVRICTQDRVITNYSFGGMSTTKSLKKMRARIRMKYRTYRRNGMSRLYWFYCVAIELAKYILG